MRTLAVLSMVTDSLLLVFQTVIFENVDASSTTLAQDYIQFINEFNLAQHQSFV